MVYKGVDADRRALADIPTTMAIMDEDHKVANKPKKVVKKSKPKLSEGPSPASEVSEEISVSEQPQQYSGGW